VWAVLPVPSIREGIKKDVPIAIKRKDYSKRGTGYIHTTTQVSYELHYGMSVVVAVEPVDP
jgi:hypothetical protein